jgi:hypothetical protein
MACDPPAEVQIGYLGEAVPESDLDQVFLTSCTGTLCSAAIICQSIVIEGTICPFHISHTLIKDCWRDLCDFVCRAKTQVFVPLHLSIFQCIHRRDIYFPFLPLHSYNIQQLTASDSFAGGVAAWDPTCRPPPELLVCACCGDPLVLLLQVFCLPLPVWHANTIH